MERLISGVWILLWVAAAIITAQMLLSAKTKAEEPKPSAATVTTIPQPKAVMPEAPVEDFENEKIEAALLEQGYLRDDIPLDYDTQALLRAACDETGVEFELALAVVWRETTFRNVGGDDGNSFGYMQVQPRWHRARMDRLGVTDLMDPAGNFRVGCDYLAELLAKYPLEQALTCYNTGRPGHNQYARDVVGYLEELK
jgi:soluble lytic murein transglycosylase-like protein